MKRVKFHVCPLCGNILTSTGTSEISCCGRLLKPLVPSPMDAAHTPLVEMVDDECFLTFSHEMSKEHFLSFVAYATCDRLLFVRLYPEQDAALRMPRLYGGRLFLYCTRHGLMVLEKNIAI